MRTKPLVCLAVMASIGLSSVAFAQDRDHDGQDRHEHRARAERMERRDARVEPDQYAYGARGPEWHRGGRIPHMYRDRQYVVSDWQEHHLRRPPRGYQWVQVGGDYVLVAIASGIIADLLLNH